jgi:DNA replication and repair protein RecF
LPHWGSEAATVTGELARAEGTRPIRRALQQHDNGRWHASGEACEWARAIAFGWHDLAIVHGAPSARRNFVDGFAARLYPSHRPALVRYRRLIEQRNSILQTHATAERLAPWNEQVATVGLELIDRRRRAVAALQGELSRVYAALSGERHKLDVAYRSLIGEASEAAALVAALERAHPVEIRRRQTVVGPHRDDLALMLDGVDVRAFGSRGQQRLLALALRLAEVLPVAEAAGTAPVLLLDDALSELDSVVRENVLREIDGAEQVFLTSPEPLTVSGAARWTVDGGGITAA